MEQGAAAEIRDHGTGWHIGLRLADAREQRYPRQPNRRTDRQDASRAAAGSQACHGQPQTPKEGD